MGRRQRRRNRETARQHALPTDVTGDNVVAAGHVGGTTGSSGQPTARLTALVQQRRQLDHAIDREIDRLARQLVGWPVIAAALGISRQAARQRHQRRGQRP